jgi:glutamate racemase
MSEEHTKPIGVFDSGIGGLTVVRELVRRLPDEDIVYFGDTARLPYGTKSPETVMRFSRQNLAFLKSKNVKLIVVACNTASSIALPALVEEEGIPVIGVLMPGARAAARATRNKRVGVIGTTATIRSNSYEEALRAIEPEIEIWSLPCPLFVPLAEEGWLDNEVAYLTAKSYLEPLASFGADTLVLGCTHYPLLREVIGKVVGDGVVLVDSAQETAAEVAGVLDQKSLLNDRGDAGTIQVYVSDVPYLIREVGERFLGRPIEKIERVEFKSTGRSTNGEI